MKKNVFFDTLNEEEKIRFQQIIDIGKGSGIFETKEELDTAIELLDRSAIFFENTNKIDNLFINFIKVYNNSLKELRAKL